MSEAVIALEMLAREIATIKHDMEKVRKMRICDEEYSRHQYRRDGMIAAYGVVLNMIMEKQLEVEE